MRPFGVHWAYCRVRAPPPGLSTPCECCLLKKTNFFFFLGGGWMGAVRAHSLLLVTKALGYVAVPICAPCHRYELLSSVVIYLCCPSPVLSCWLEFFRICHFLNLLFPNCKGAPWTWQETLRGGGGALQDISEFHGKLKVSTSYSAWTPGSRQSTVPAAQAPSIRVFVNLGSGICPGEEPVPEQPHRTGNEEVFVQSESNLCELVQCPIGTHPI